MRNSYIHVITFLLVIMLSSCVPPAELKSAREAVQSDDLIKAHEYYVEALKKSPNNKEILTELDGVRRTLTERAIQKSESVIGPSTPANATLLRSALAILDQAGEYDPDGTYLGAARKGFEARIAEIENANRAREGQVLAALQGRNLELARQTLDEIALYDPQYENLGVLESEYLHEVTTSAEETIKSLLKENRIQEARSLLNKLKAINVPADYSNRISKVIDEHELQWMRTEVADKIRNNQFYTAYRMITDSGHSDMFSRELSDIRVQGARFYLKQAQLRQQRGEISRAYLESVKGYELDPRLSGIFEIHRDTRDVVLKNLQKYIAIPAFGAPNDNPDLGPQFSDALISYLFRILPYGINIVEREKIDMLVDERKRELSEMGNILNVDLIITGNVSLMEIDRQVSEQNASTRVKVGEKNEINPEYELLLKTYGSNIAAVPDLPPRTIAVPVYENFPYKKGETTLKGFATVSARIFDVQKGRITYAQEFNARYEAADKYQDSVEIAGIEGDPLQLPTDTEVMENLRNKIISQISEVIEKQFSKRGETYVEEAKYYLVRKEPEKAVESLAPGFLYFIKAKEKSSNPLFSELRDLIVEHTEKDFLISDGAVINDVSGSDGQAESIKGETDE